jgi:hypothetical protein
MGRAGRGGLDAVGTELARAPSDVHDVYVVKKQLYISEEHERALKAKARELGVSEAELVRRMLDGLLLDGEEEGLPGQVLRGPGGFPQGGQPAGGIPPLPERVCVRPKRALLGSRMRTL